MARRKSIKLKTPQEVKRAISRIANMVLNNEINPKVANTLIYACNAALASIRADEYRQKVEELEILLNEMTK